MFQKIYSRLILKYIPLKKNVCRYPVPFTRSFFTSIPESNKPPKRISVKPANDVKQEETSSSPIQIKKRKRERPLIQSDDEDEKLSDTSSKSPGIKEESSPEKKQVDKFRDFFKSERSTKRIKTYSKLKEEIEVEVDLKEEKVDFESNEIEKSSRLTLKSKKNLNNFFGVKIGTETTCKNTDLSDSNMSQKSVKTSIKDVNKEIENFDPSKKNYHPVNDACWNEGEKVPYLALCKTLDVIEGISARLKMTEVLSNFFRSVILLSPEDLITCIYLCLNKLAPDYEGIELGVGDMVLMKAIGATTGKSIESLKSELAAKGDLGIVAESCRTNQRTMFALPKLTSKAVYVKLREIAEMSGHSSTNKKVEKIQSLLVACHRLEARYLIRSLIGKLRIGLAEQSLLAALAQAVTLTPPDQKESSKQLSKEDYSKLLEKNTMIIKSTYCECPSYDAIIPVLLKDGINELSKNCKITPGVPVKPMLAHPTKGVSEILKRFQECTFTCEFKYDGERAQIHVLDDNSIKIYSRNQEDCTSKYPDVISRLSKTLCDNVKSCILDTEAVAWDKVNKQILPFQILSTRKRKDASESQIKVQVCIFAFDLIYLNGRSLVAEPLQERRKLLHKHFKEIDDEFAFVTRKDSNDVDEIAVFLDEAIKNKCEGLMVKTLETNATYEIAKRSHNWLKLKKDYLEGVGDTLDLVVIGGYYGKGKRAGNYGGFLLACYDPESEQFQTITKIGTGFKDEDLVQHSLYLKEHVIPKPKSYYQYDSSQVPDVWFDATQVWEVKCADLSISPVYKAAAGIVDPIKGISIRFPRFMRIRDDKNPEDATSSEQVVTMYESQESVK